MIKKYTLLPILALLVLVFTTFHAFAEIDAAKENAILSAVDESILIETIQQDGTTEDDIFYKGIACRRLAVIGKEDAVPALAKMLPGDVRLSDFARYALEAMPFESVNKVLLDGAQNIEPKTQRLGCILSLGVRGCVEAVPVLKNIVQNPKTTCDKKAAYAALGMIAAEDAANFLMECAKTTSEDEIYLVRKRLADALLDSAVSFEKAGNSAKAIEIYDSVVVPCFPVYAQKAGAYHALLARKAQGVEILISKLESPKQCCFTGGLKTVREFGPEDGEAVTKACIAELAKLPVERRALVVRALGDRTDDASRTLVFPVLKDLVRSGEPAMKIAAIQALKKVGTLSPMETIQAFADAIPAADAEMRQEQLDAMVATASALKCAKVDAFLVSNIANVPLDDPALASAFFQVLENRRVAAAGPELVKIANIAGINAQVRDRVLGALSEIVTLDSLNLLVEALNGETDDGKVAWILRAACTRLPREECAKAVEKMFAETSDVTEKGKLITLLKQIGGKSALDCVEKACWDPATADVATQTLGTWNTPDDALDVAAACLKIAQESTEERFQIRGIRSYIRIPRQFDLPKEKKFEMCKIAFDAAKRPQDKLLIFEVFTRVIDVASAQAAMEYASDPAFKEIACETVIAIAKKFTGKSEEFKAILKKVSETSENYEVIGSAEEIMERM